jgi:hypothetical protein
MYPVDAVLDSTQDWHRLVIVRSSLLQSPFSTAAKAQFCSLLCNSQIQLGKVVTFLRHWRYMSSKYELLADAVDSKRNASKIELASP